MYLCNNPLCIIKFRLKIQEYQMLKLHEHLNEALAGLALWREHLPSTNVARVRFLHSASNVD